MQKEKNQITVNLNGEEVIYKFNDSLKAYHKLRLKGRGTRDYYYLVNVPRLYDSGTKLMCKVLVLIGCV
jgi:hypothetical protein